jgi:diacylglycerol kinase (ATP)
LKKRIVVIFNPASGPGHGQNGRNGLERLFAREVAALAEVDRVNWEIRETTAAGHAVTLAKQAADEGAGIVAAAGGDGTLSEALNGLVNSTSTLGVIPMGTGNDFARHLGIGTDRRLAVRTLLCGVPKPIDIGRTQGRWFLNVAGCGFDAVVAERVNRGFRFIRGTAAYIAAVIETLRTFQAADMRVTLDGETVELRAMLCSIANASYYGGGMHIAPDARLDDGLFDVCLLAEAGKMEFLSAFPRVFKGTHTTHPKVTMRRARHVRIESDPSMPVLVDGEVVGKTPVEFVLVPGAIQVMTPHLATR